MPHSYCLTQDCVLHNMLAKTFLLTGLVCCVATGAFAQDIGILAEPTPPPKTKKALPVNPKKLPPRKSPEKSTKPTETEDSSNPPKPKQNNSITLITSPAECEIYINDAYRGTTAAKTGKLVINDLAPELTYTLRVYKRGFEETVQDLQVAQNNTNLAIALKDNSPQNTIATTPKDPTNDPKPPANPSDPITTPTTAPNSVANNPTTNNSTTNNSDKIERGVIQPRVSEMVLIPAGDFIMGSGKASNTVTGKARDPLESQRPQHKVYVPAYYIDVHEVTNADYKLFCDATSRSYPKNPQWDNNYFLDKPTHPVLNVSWEDASAYAQWVGKRLPTEEEWEKAARGNDTRTWPWGKEFQTTNTNLSGSTDGYDFTAPVGSFRSGVSPYGVHDLIGNVWEWTSSYYRPYPGGNTTIDGRYSQDFRVIRGGSYQISDSALRGLTIRLPSPPNVSYEATGFRCARSAE
jgi:formylglycine-generating enzyme required for sulfatase activity